MRLSTVLLLLLAAPTGAGATSAVTPMLAARAPSTAPASRYVREAQRALRDLGYSPGPVDGIVGPRTKEALTRYQRAERIPVTGLLDPETMVRLDIQNRLFDQARAR